METNGDLLGSEAPLSTPTEATAEKPPPVLLLEEEVTSAELKQATIIELESSPPRICETESHNNNGPAIISLVEDEEEVEEPVKPRDSPKGEIKDTEEEMPELTVQSDLPVQRSEGKEDDEGPPEITGSVEGENMSATTTDNSDLTNETEPKITEDQSIPAITTEDNVGNNKNKEQPGVDDSMDDSSLRPEADNVMETSTAAGASDTANNTPPTARKERKKRKTRSELDRLLMDEGTVKILMGPAAATVTSPNVSKKDKLKELSKYREEVINQVRDSSKSKLFSKVSLREKSKSRRQQQQEKNAKKAKLEPTSKIIRRRSSSSNFNFSSRSPSPVHLSPTAPLQSSADDPVQVRVHDSVGYITIASEAVLFNTQITSRLTTTLNSLKLDNSVTVVQVTTTNNFIQGLDIEAVRSETDDSLRQSMADSMVACLDSLLKTLTNYPKLLVAGVSGDAVDFGVLILSYFDLVYASDKATFQTNYVKNGYLPECLQLFPKNRLTYAMLYTGKKLTATEGVTSGLVTEVLWPAKYQAELASRIRALTAGNEEVLLRTKDEVNTKNPSKLELTRDLRSSWLGF